MLQNATPLRKSALWPPNISDEPCLLYCACHAACIFADPLQVSHACQRFWNCYKTLTLCSLLAGWRIPCACHAKRHLTVQTYSEPVSFFTLLTSKCASRHNGVPFSDMSTSKSGPSMVCFVHFDFEMCFAPQRRALCWHLNFQTWSEHGVSLAFWLRHVLRAATACTLLTLRCFVRFYFETCSTPQQCAIVYLSSL